MKQMFRLSALLLICLMSTCGVQTTQGGDGGATETVNAQVIICDSTVTVTIKSDTAVLADIIIFNENYNPITKYGFCDSITGISADSQAFFQSLNGKYNLLILERLSQKSLTFNSVSAGSMLSDTIDDTLCPYGSIEGKVFFKEPYNTENLIQVYLKGTFYHTGTDSDGTFQMQQIPQGTYFLNAMMSTSKNSPGRSVGKEVQIQSSMKTDGVTLFFSE